jgi:hypothetical protein
MRLRQLGSAETTVSTLMLVAGEEHRFLVADQLCENGIAIGYTLLAEAKRDAYLKSTGFKVNVCQG